MFYLYISKEEGCGTSRFRVPRYPVTVIGKILPEEPNGSENGHWETGKTGRKTAHKPGDFGIRRTPYGDTIFPGFADWALRKCV